MFLVPFFEVQLQAPQLVLEVQQNMVTEPRKLAIDQEVGVTALISSYPAIALW